MAVRGHAIVISSVSGGGKTSLIQMLTRVYPELKTVITATSRPIRTGERHGVHYFFLTRQEFEQRISRGEFLEHAYVHGNHYGVPLDQVQNHLGAGNSVILNIDVQGMRRVRELLPGEVLSIFLLPPGREEWERRLRGRGTDSEEVIQNRLAVGVQELEAAKEYDYRIVNDVLERAAGELSVLLRERGILK